MRRAVTPELMDDPAADRGELAESLAYIRGVNRRMGGVSALLKRLAVWSSNWPAGRPVTLLDLGTGSADLPVAARAWARGRGFDLRVTAVDNHPTTLELARRHVEASGERVGPGEGIDLVLGDATGHCNSLRADAFDYVHAGLFLHHLKEIGVLTLLAAMDRVAARGVVWNDLVRSRVGLAAITLMTLRSRPMVKHDARASVRAGFSRREAVDLARRAGLTYAEYRWSLFTHRFTIAGEKPGAWA